MEAEFIQWLSRQLPPAAARHLADDAAVLDAGNRVATTDLLLDGVHFNIADTGVGLAGRKALAASLSDLAAMGASPRAALVSLALPRTKAAEIARQVMQGMLPLAERFGLEIVGGDTNTWDGPLAINVAAWGCPTHGVLSRRGARPGDVLVVTGQLGGSLLGRHLRFEPRVAEALWLMEHCPPHAGMDVSDGLALDLSRLLDASQCGARVRGGRVPIHEDAVRRSLGTGRTPLQHALHDGEDFELLLAMSPESAERAICEWPSGLAPLSCCGQLTEDREMWLGSADGHWQPLPAEGYLHGEAAS